MLKWYLIGLMCSYGDVYENKCQRIIAEKPYNSLGECSVMKEEMYEEMSDLIGDERLHLEFVCVDAIELKTI